MEETVRVKAEGNHSVYLSCLYTASVARENPARCTATRRQGSVHSFTCRVKMTGSCGNLSPDSKCFDHLLHLNSTWNAAV